MSNELNCKIDAMLDFGIKVNRFLESDLRNTIIETPVVKLYTRKSFRNLGIAGYAQCLDIANIVVAKKYRKSGICSGIISYMEEQCLHSNFRVITPDRETINTKGVFVESILTQFLAESLAKRGYVEKEQQLDLFGDFVSVDMYKIIN